MRMGNNAGELPNLLTSRLFVLLKGKGAATTGAAVLDGVAGYPFPDLPVAVSIGYQLNPVVVREIRCGPTDEYILEYTRVNQELSQISEVCVRYLRDQGYHAVAIDPTLPLVERNHLHAEFPHKTAATRSGIGWIGKCALLVTRTYGSAIRLTTVCTNAPLTTGKPVVHSYCGDCAICVDSCPVKAPSGKNWEPVLHRDQFWDADACFLHCEETQTTSLTSAQVCGVCIAACPYTRRYVQGSS
ncbi:epoxyqueuosine reductase [uncultured Methanospirillum sp.]|uniref:epoxyqueuosine reductase n=1 Tax=uncultured Methanospirillum sp. TaxID=262503 RepID=UPI0029C65214|nr:epoxyqueuosine reductase [uncultured Methanospirillum sp.]